eukprot:SAG31_NODE_167_length_21485_cov_31.094922_17_plen_111_part_00
MPSSKARTALCTLCEPPLPEVGRAAISRGASEGGGQRGRRVSCSPRQGLGFEQRRLACCRPGQPISEAAAAQPAVAPAADADTPPDLPVYIPVMGIPMEAAAEQRNASLI